LFCTYLVGYFNLPQDTIKTLKRRRRRRRRRRKKTILLFFVYLPFLLGFFHSFFSVVP
jgi:hypothetical protein